LPRIEPNVDYQLTDGYARALALEADCLTTLRGITDAAATGADPAVLKRLATRLGDMQIELAELRAELDQLRRRIDPHGRLY
jgi:hypothetical protein